MIMSRKSIKGAIIGTLVVIIMFLIFISIFSAVIIKEKVFYDNAEKVYGTVDEVSKHTSYSRRGRRTTYTFYVSYMTVDGQQYKRVKAEYVNVNGSAYSRGDNIVVAYDVNNPKKIGVGTYSNNIVNIIMLVVFGALTVYFFVLILKNYKKLKTTKNLMTNGIKGVSQITNITTTGRGKNTAYIIDCVAINPMNGQPMQTSGKVQNIKNLGINKTLDTYFDPQEPEIYFINLD